MTKIAPETEAEAEDSDFKPDVQVQERRKRHPAVSVALGKNADGGGGAGGLGGLGDLRWRRRWPGLQATEPWRWCCSAALFARGMARQKRAVTAGAAMVGFLAGRWSRSH